MNKFICIGRLIRDPEIRQSGGDTTVAKFTLAVDRRFAKKDENQQTADFITHVAFGKTAEFIEKYCHQGTKVAVEGRIQTGSYTNKDGQKVYTTDVVVENIEFAKSKNSGSGNSSAPQSTPQNQPTGPVPQANSFMNIPMGVEDSGLPF